MRRADRRDDSDDNSIHNPTSRQAEPTSPHELRSLLLKARSDRDELRQSNQTLEQKAQQNHQLYLEAQQKHQSTLTLYQEEQHRYRSTLTLYQEAHTQAQTYLTLYNQEQSRTIELSAKYETADAERQQYLTLYTWLTDTFPQRRGQIHVLWGLPHHQTSLWKKPLAYMMRCGSYSVNSAAGKTNAICIPWFGWSWG